MENFPTKCIPSKRVKARHKAFAPLTRLKDFARRVAHGGSSKGPSCPEAIAQQWFMNKKESK